MRKKEYQYVPAITTFRGSWRTCPGTPTLFAPSPVPTAPTAPTFPAPTSPAPTAPTAPTFPAPTAPTFPVPTAPSAPTYPAPTAPTAPTSPAHTAPTAATSPAAQDLVVPTLAGLVKGERQRSGLGKEVPTKSYHLLHFTSV